MTPNEPNSAISNVGGKLQWGQHILKLQHLKLSVNNKLSNSFKMNNQQNINLTSYLRPRKCEMLEKVLVVKQVLEERNNKRVKKLLLPTLLKAICLLLNNCVNAFVMIFSHYYWAQILLGGNVFFILNLCYSFGVEYFRI